MMFKIRERHGRRRMRARRAPAELRSAARRTYEAHRSINPTQHRETKTPNDKSGNQKTLTTSAPQAQTKQTLQHHRRQRRTTQDLQTPRPGFTTCTHRGRGEERDYYPKTDPDSREASSSRRRSLLTLPIRVLLWFTKWVLISTLTLCVATHLTALPIMPPHTHYTTLCPQSLHHSSPHLTTHQPTPETPHAMPPPEQPTHHKQHHTKVSIKTCTYHRSHTHPSNTRKNHYRPLESLPPSESRRLPPPPESTKSISAHQPYQTHPLHTKHNPKKPHCPPHPAPMRHHDPCQKYPNLHTRHPQNAIAQPDIPPTDPHSSHPPKTPQRTKPLNTQTKPIPTKQKSAEPVSQPTTHSNPSKTTQDRLWHTFKPPDKAKIYLTSQLTLPYYAHRRTHTHDAPTTPLPDHPQFQQKYTLQIPPPYTNSFISLSTLCIAAPHLPLSAEIPPYLPHPLISLPPLNNTILPHLRSLHPSLTSPPCPHTLSSHLISSPPSHTSTPSPLSYLPTLPTPLQTTTPRPHSLLHLSHNKPPSAPHTLTSPDRQCETSNTGAGHRLASQLTMQGPKKAASDIAGRGRVESYNGTTDGTKQGGRTGAGTEAEGRHH